MYIFQFSDIRAIFTCRSTEALLSYWEIVDIVDRLGWSKTGMFVFSRPIPDFCDGR